MTAHQKCVDAGQHLCAEPSGRVCIEQGCAKPAGTWWGPLWCPEHDKQRMDRIDANLTALLDSFPRGGLR